MAVKIKGVVPILSTPFDGEGQLDIESLRRLIRYCLDAGAVALAGLGDVSECHKLTESERCRIADVMVEEAGGKVPVIVGASATSIEATVLHARYATDAGADIVLVKPTIVGLVNERAIRALYDEVASATDLPIMLHDQDQPWPVPVRVLAELVEQIPQIQYIKEEIIPSGQKVRALRDACGEELTIISGLGGRSFVDDLIRGADGNMPGCHIIKPLVNVYERMREGDEAAARREHNRVSPLIVFRQVPAWGAAITKEILCMHGIISTTKMREPAGMLPDDDDRRELKAILESIGPVI